MRGVERLSAVSLAHSPAGEIGTSGKGNSRTYPSRWNWCDRYHLSEAATPRGRPGKFLAGRCPANSTQLRYPVSCKREFRVLRLKPVQVVFPHPPMSGPCWHEVPMNRTSSFVLFMLIGAFTATAQAGWHHRHQYYQVYQTPYVVGQMPALQMQFPAADFQMQFSDSQMRALAGHLAAAQAAAAQPSFAPQELRGTADELRRLIGDLKDRLLEGNLVEDDGSGGSSEIKRELAKLRTSLTARADKVDSELDKHAKHIAALYHELDRLKNGKTPAAVKKALDSDAFKSAVQDLLKPGVKIEDAVKSLKDKIENTLE